MTNSEKLLSYFSEDFFYKELVYADERRPDDEEFAEVMKILKEEGAIISDKYIAPDCDWYQNCTIGEGVFDILYSIDGDGTFLYTESGKTLEVLERLFANNHNKNTTE